MAGVAPLGPADGYAVLGTASVADQWTRLGTLLVEQSELLEARVAMAAADDDGFDEL
jgi:hypothetical protein